MPGPSPDVFLRLPHELAGDFLGVVESFREQLSNLADSVPWDQRWPDAHAAPSVVAARTFSIRSRDGGGRAVHQALQAA